MKPLTGRGVLLWLTGFFGIIIATNAIFITEAVKTFRGEDEQKPYLQGVEYNRTLAHRAEQAKLGWHASIDARRLPAGNAEILVALRHRDGSPETGARLAGELRHPSDEHRDRTLRFSQVSAGLYQATIQAAPGNWDVLVSNTEGAPFQATRRLWLQ
ncbi:MAG TPA: FixH family protein [Rhizomicrobium sp.]|jgi:nitrogen fixation protein FixH|nr:FixH family protein [Rhizomicrobium sp.]